MSQEEGPRGAQGSHRDAEGVRGKRGPLLGFIRTEWTGWGSTLSNLTVG